MKEGTATNWWTQKTHNYSWFWPKANWICGGKARFDIGADASIFGRQWLHSKFTNNLPLSQWKIYFHEVIAHSPTWEKEQRFFYVNLIVEAGIYFNDMWFVNERGFNTWLRRSYGRLRKGERAYRTAHEQRGKNMSLCLALFLHPTLCIIIDGACDRVKFKELISEIDSLSQEQKYLIIDNCRIHYQVDSTNHQLKFLSPYIPFLNPIEAFLANWKITFGVSCAMMTLKICSKQREVMPSNKKLLMQQSPASIPIAFRKTIF